MIAIDNVIMIPEVNKVVICYFLGLQLVILFVATALKIGTTVASFN